MGWKGTLVEPLVWAAGLAFGRHGFAPEIFEPRDILVLRTNDLGDLLTATPIFDALRRRFPTAKLIAGVGSWATPVLENSPFVDEVVELDAPWNNKFVKDQSWRRAAQFLTSSPQIEELRRRGGFDVGIDLLGSHIGTLMMIRLGVRFRVGVRGYRGGWSGCQRFATFSRGVHVSRAALSQAALLGLVDLPDARPQLFLVDSERAEARSLWNQGQRERHIRVLVGCGGGSPEKCYPEEAFGKVLAALPRAVPTAPVKLDILLIGGSGDRERASKIRANCQDSVRSLCGLTSLRATFALAEQADFVVTNSSMLLHASAAFHRPTLAILGGPNADAASHDRLWGYPAPYTSVGPLTQSGWPEIDEVVAAFGAMYETREVLINRGGWPNSNSGISGISA